MACLLMLAASHPVAAQGTPTVALGDPLYRDLDVLIEAGWVRRVIVGQRPYSRAAVGRMTAEGATRVDSARAAGAQILRTVDVALDHLSARLHRVPRPESQGRDGAAVALLQSLTVDALLTDEPSRTVPSNGLGTVEADLNTLTDHAGGRRFGAGWNPAIETEHWLELRKGVSFQVQPRLSALLSSREGRSGIRGDLLSGSARAVVRNVAFTLGREYTLWSQTDGAGLMFSDNPPALDMIRVASDAPFELPWIFSRLGPVAGTLQLATLGPSVASSGSLLVSYKVSVKPWEAAEIGGSFHNHFGGVGAPPTSLGSRLLDLSPFLDVFRRHADSTDLASDKLLGADGRWRLQALGNLTLVGEIALEDFDPKRLRSIFTEDAAYTAGIILPQGPGGVSARVAFHSVGIRFYEHHLLTNGIASRRFTLGDDLGHDASGWFGSLAWQGAGASTIRLDGAREVRHNDPFGGGYTLPGQLGLVFVRLGTVPAESRSRILVNLLNLAPPGGVAMDVSVGVERIVNFGFVETSPELHGLGRVTLRSYW